MRDSEIIEAIHAGEQALSSLREAQSALKTAGLLGYVDMFGGGFFTTMLKRNRMKAAQRLMEDAAENLRLFERELEDVEDAGLQLDTGALLTFADYFFDGFLSDLLVQSKIHDAQSRLDNAIFKVESLVSKLRGMR